MRKGNSIAIVRKCTFINMALTVATNVDNKALVGKLALLNNIAVLSKDAALLSIVALLGKLPPWANSPSLAKLPSLANSPLGEVMQTCFLWQIATGVIASIPLALMQALCCPHCRHCLGAVDIIAVVALASSRTLPWRSCGPPFTGVNAFLLFIHSSKSISLIDLILAPALTTVLPAFAADGARPFLLLHGSLI